VVVTAGPAAASGTATRTSSVITYQHTGGTADHVEVATDGGQVVISVDEGITPGSGCTTINAQSVFCAPAPLVVVTGGDFDDTLVAKEVAGATVQLFGGGGVDTVTGNSTANVLDGGSGNDVLSGSDGADQMTGGPGSDTIGGGTGNDVISSQDGEVDAVNCGDGADTVIADAADVLTGCETAQLPPPPPPAKVTPTFTFKLKDKTAHGVLVKKLAVGGLTAADAVSVACKGKDCPFRSATGKVAGGSSKLTKLFKKQRVSKLTLTITVTRAGAIGVVETLKLKKGKVKASAQCVAPGSTSPVSC
jgi:Ca2+-binding RTX toxin-like protein